MKDQTAGSGTVFRHGSVSDKKKDHRHKKKGCRSAPEDPQNVSLHFRKRNEGHRTTWRGIVRFDAVTTDVAGRDLSPEHYEAELRAVDASGDPVETHGQEVSTHTDGADFTVQAGSAPVVGKARRLEAVNARIATNLTGLTTGIEVGVDCYARKDTGAADSRVHFAVWDTVLGTEVAQKNGDPDTIKPKLTSTLSFTPVAGHGYELRATFQSGSTGKPLIQGVQWHDKGDEAIWRHRVPGDADRKRAAFPDLAKPKVWYYQARCRALNRMHGARCWSAWSAWTAATNPVTGDPIGPPAPDGLTLTFHRDEARKNSPFQAKAEWNELPWWMPPDGEPVEGADRYAVRLAISNDGGGSTIRTRRHSLQAKDDDADQTAFFEFHNIRRSRFYRFSVRAFKDDRRGAWSTWSAWKSPTADIGSGPNAATNVQQVKLRPGHFRVTWDPPANKEDVDKYRIRVYAGGVLKDTSFTRSEHFRYAVPEADRGTAHRFKVTAVDEDLNLSAEADQGSDTDDTTDADVLPNPPGQPSNPSLAFDTNGTRHAKYRAVVTAGTSSTGGPPARYVLQLVHHATNTGATPPAGVRRHHQSVEGDATGDDLTEAFKNIPKSHYVWVRERARNAGGASAWTGWVGGVQPSGAASPNGAGTVTATAPTPRRVKATWAEPDDDTTTRWRVVVKKGANTVETGHTRSNRFIYHVPIGDTGVGHTVDVVAISDTGTEATPATSNSVTPDPDASAVGDSFEIGDVRKLAHVSLTNWLVNHPKWLRANGQALATASYPGLFAEIGYTYGGAGASFNLPDMNGRHSIGVSSVIAVGANDGDLEANRLAVHAHASDGTNASPTPDTTYTDVGTGDQQNTPGADYTQEQTSHGHFIGNSSGPSNTVANIAAQGSQVLPSSGHSHNIPNAGPRDQTHDHQGHNHANHGHNHAHNNANHHHSHGHGAHPHPHAHDQKKRPHIAVHYVIKVLP